MRRRVLHWVVGLAASVLAAAGSAHADLTLTKDAPDLPLTEGLRVSDISQWGRRAINVDGVVQMMVDGTLGEPKAGDVVKRPEAMGGGERKWEEVKANEKGEFGGEGGGWVRGGAGSYVLCIVEAEEPRVMVLTGIGHSMVYVNGEPRVGDPYMHGYVRIPVALKKGRNQLLFAHAGRGMFKAKLETPSKSGGVEINTGDLTLPDVLTDTPGEYMLGVPLVNCSETSQRVVIFATGPGGLEPARGSEVVIVPLGIYKAPVSVALKAEAGEGGAGGATEMKVRLRIFDADVVPPARNTPGADIRPLSEETITLRVRQPHEIHKRTFISAIDGSVQYVAIVPPKSKAEEGKSGGAGEKANASGSESRPTQRPGLVLSLHGASVEAIRQAESYAPKDDLVIVCPTNRRPFGFDWEDWGRVDAIEAMDHAKKWYDTDPSRQYLTGHSMGGHGTWQLGVLYPDRFAAIAPSAGWLSFESYAAARGDADKKPEHPAAEFFRRASASSDTVALMENLRGKGIYILHGDADDNVPVSEARKARAELDKLGIAYEFHEEPGAGHWWGGKNDPGFGAACVDWKPIFEMFERTRLPTDGAVRTGTRRDLMRSVAGWTEDTGIAITRRERDGMLSEVRVIENEAEKRLSIQTTNVRVLILPDLLTGHAFGWAFLIDGDAFDPSGGPQRTILFKGEQSKWRNVRASDLDNRAKYHGLTGPFKGVFNDGFTLAYGDGGSPEQRAWALAKARYDADQWWYRGNGRARVVSSSAWQNSGEWGKVPQRPVVLYGNSNTNSVIDGGMRDTSVYVSDELMYAAGKRMEGDRSVLCVQSFGGRGLLGLVGGTSLRAMRATDRMPYFLSGVGFPDVTVLDADIWSRGMNGVAGVGFFGYDWSVERGEFWWSAPPAK